MASNLKPSETISNLENERDQILALSRLEFPIATIFIQILIKHSWSKHEDFAFFLFTYVT